MKRALLTLTLGLALIVSAEAQGGRGQAGTHTTKNGTTVSGAAGRAHGQNGSAAARNGSVTGAQGGTATTKGARVTTKQGGAHKGESNWDGQNSTGEVQSQGSWQAGEGGQGSSSAEVTNKNTGETHSVESSTEYDPTTGGSTTVTTGSGTTKTVEYP